MAGYCAATETLPSLRNRGVANDVAGDHLERFEANGRHLLVREYVRTRISDKDDQRADEALNGAPAIGSNGVPRLKMNDADPGACRGVRTFTDSDFFVTSRSRWRSA